MNAVADAGLPVNAFAALGDKAAHHTREFLDLVWRQSQPRLVCIVPGCPYVEHADFNDDEKHWTLREYYCSMCGQDLVVTTG